MEKYLQLLVFDGILFWYFHKEMRLIHEEKHLQSSFFSAGADAGPDHCSRTCGRGEGSFRL
jgi:hypothetical protein